MDLRRDLDSCLQLFRETGIRSGLRLHYTLIRDWNVLMQFQTFQPRQPGIDPRHVYNRRDTAQSSPVRRIFMTI